MLERLASAETAIEDLQTDVDNKISKSGDVMTGNLEIDNTSPGAILKNTAMDVTDSSYAPTVNSTGFRLRDKNGINVAIIADRYFSDGSTGLWLTGLKNVNGSNFSNSLGLYVDKNGNRVVGISDAAPWRQALGLGTNGALPITIAQGGTGSTTKNFVDLSNEQTIGGHKIFTSWVMIDRSASAVGTGNLLNILAFKYKNPQGYAKEAQVIRTYVDTETAANNAIVILGSNSGTTILGAGESIEPVIDANQSISNTENIYLIADGSINLWTGGNQSTGAVTKAVTISSRGNATFVAIPYVSGTSPGYVGKYTNMTDTTAPSSNTNCFGFRIRDKNDANIALYTDYWGSNGSQGVMISGYRNGVANALYMLVTSSGERYVSVSSPAAWRTALGLGTVATQSTVAIANGGTGKTTAAEANAALGAKYWKNSSAITSSQSRTLTFSAAVRCVLYLVNTVTGNSGEYLVYCGGATSTPVITTVKAAGNVTLTAAAGKITFTSTHTSNQYVYAMNLTNNPGSMTFA